MKRPMKSFVLAIGLAAFACLASEDAATQSQSCFVNTGNGDVRGSDLGASCAFLGIPYAAPPVNALRWKPPQAAAPWTTPLDVVAPPSGCSSIVLPAGNLIGSEDCLKLNLWMPDPAPSTPAPVIVWLHSGAFYTSSANFPSHNGQRLAEETGAIVVAPNYRLGPFGFLAHSALAAEDPSYPSSGNYGLLDQRAALTWVRDNIGRFGGDPANVTLAGTSAGAVSVGAHMVSPGSSGLFHRAIVESGSPTVRMMSHDEATTQGSAFASALGCADPAQVVACMRGKTRQQVTLALPTDDWQAAEPAGKVFWHPVVDGIEIPDQPRLLFEAGAFAHVPTIVGTNRDEGLTFVTRSFPSGVTLAQYESWVANEFGPHALSVLATYPASDFATPLDAMARVIGDVDFVCEARRVARHIADARTPVFVYSYEYEIDDVFPNAAPHGVESNIIFGNDYVPARFPNHVLDAADLSLHAAMAGYWTRFARTGNPNVDDDSVVHWPAFKDPQGPGRAANKHIVFDTTIEAGKRLREVACDFWEPLFLRTTLNAPPAATP
ncbi:MAG TPA: carboxylesterase family protein [Vicinamibacterales bacterium]